MKISVNILTWNNIQTIGKMLAVLKDELQPIEHEYIFIDNGSKDGTFEFINKWIVQNLKDNFKLVGHAKNEGISYGKNAGIDSSKGEFILMLDGDVVPVPNTIRLMLEWLENNPDQLALGMYPNKFSTTEDHAEKFCRKLVDFRKDFKCVCLYYGMFRRAMFYDGLRMSVEGEFGKEGYGWEDHDFFKRMQERGYNQCVAHINKPQGKYYHAINSSIRAMGREKYMETSRLRDKQFKRTWEKADAS